jgi:hypothetical protein
MTINQLFGLAILISGGVLLGFGYHFSQAPVDQITNSLTGRYTDNTMWYVIGGIGGLIAGGVVFLAGKRL